jgi:acetoin utilization deacetylase AcuC-like enzyme
MTTAYLYDERFLEHELLHHPERPDRLRAIMQTLTQNGTLARMKRLEFEAALPEQIAPVHAPRYITLIRELCERGGGRLDMDTYLTPKSYEIARLAAGACIVLADVVYRRDMSNGFAFVRPPGHHATPAQGMGFCLFNNVAVAARYLIDTYQLRRVMIVDYDVHHGNGTQDIFYHDARVLYVSTHQYPHYPGTGHWRETGQGEGKGATLNVPLPAGIGDKGYAYVFAELIKPMAERFRPQFIFISAGFDAHHLDPLAEMKLSVKGYAQLTRQLLQLAHELCEGRIAIVLEGGYDLEALGYGADAVCRVLLGDPIIPDPIGPPEIDLEESITDYVKQLKAFHLLV